MTIAPGKIRKRVRLAKSEFKEQVTGPSLIETKEEEEEEEEETSNIVINARYEVIELIGKGGMGSVFKVKDRTSDKIFAIKLLHPNLAKDQTAIKRFEQEVEATCQLTHPNLVNTFEHGTTPDGAPYLVMEYIEGVDLFHTISGEQKQDSERVLNVWLQLCAALEHAHDKGLIHRDIKPTNVLISKTEEGIETARLVDFGIAKILASQTRETLNLTETGAVFGSPHYMSPEHCLGFMTDERSDIYSLGCLMYEMLTGHPPFSDGNPVQIVVKHINDEAKPFPPDCKFDAIRESLEGVTLRCLEKEPERRYQSVAELARDLDLVKNGKKPAKFVRKKATRAEFTKAQITTVAAGVLLVVINAFCYSGWFGGESFRVMLGSLMGLIVIGGGYAFLAAAIDKFKSIASGNASSRNYWALVLYLSLAMASIAYFQNAITNIFDLSPLTLLPKDPAWIRDVYGLWPCMERIGVVLAAVAAVGCAVGRSMKRTTIWKFALQYAMVACLCLFVSSTFFAKQTSSAILNACYGRSIEKTIPAVGEALLQYAVFLDSENERAVSRLAKLQAAQNRLPEAEKTFKTFFARSNDNDALGSTHFEKSQLYVDPPQVSKRFAELDAAIAYSPRAQYLEERANLHWQQGDNKNALADFNLAISCQPGATEAFIGRALVHSSQGDLKLALHELDKLSALESDSQDPDVYFVRGLIHQNLNEVSAINDFRKFLEISNRRYHRGGVWGTELSMRKAYAYKVLGDTDKLDKELNTLKSEADYEEVREELSQKFKRAGFQVKW